jgi:hypothetical protein
MAFFIIATPFYTLLINVVLFYYIISIVENRGQAVAFEDQSASVVLAVLFIGTSSDDDGAGASVNMPLISYRKYFDGMRMTAYHNVGLDLFSEERAPLGVYIILYIKWMIKLSREG